MGNGNQESGTRKLDTPCHPDEGRACLEPAGGISCRSGMPASARREVLPATAMAILTRPAVIPARVEESLVARRCPQDFKTAPGEPCCGRRCFVPQRDGRGGGEVRRWLSVRVAVAGDSSTPLRSGRYDRVRLRCGRNDRVAGDASTSHHFRGNTPRCVLYGDLRGPIFRTDMGACSYGTLNAEPLTTSHLPFRISQCPVPSAQCPRVQP
ncbi:hypothetical protein BH20CHL4_BH20CHL4_09300 [soil metagenome]